MGLFFPVGPSLAKLGMKPSGRILSNKKTFYRGKLGNSSVTPFHDVLHTNIFPTMQEACQSEFLCKRYATQKLTFPFSHL